MIYKSSTAYSFGKSDKKTDKSLINQSKIKDNPDIYKYQGDIIIKPTKGFKFSKEEKLKTNVRKIPGPGEYNINKHNLGDDAPKYSINKSEKETQFGKLIRRNKNNKIPGPSDYSITEENCEKTIFNRTITNHFGKNPKLKLIDNKVPGVGKYSTICNTDFGKSNKNKYTMSKTVRKDIVDFSKNNSSAKNKNDIIALEPGKYEIKSDFGSGGIKPLLRGKPKDVKKFEIPGPGKYNSENAKIKTLKKNPTTCLGFGKRTDITEKEIKKNIPGFKYEIKSEFDVSDKSKIKANTFEKSPRMKENKNLTPGPGSYYIPCSFGVVADYEKMQENKYKKVQEKNVCGLINIKKIKGKYLFIIYLLFIVK